MEKRAGDGVEDLFAEARQATLSAEELLRRYCTLAYARLGSYEAAAERLGLDRRTVRAKVDEALLGRLRMPVGGG
jgi:hypothetical protein